MALVGKAGVDAHAYLEILTSTLFAAPVYRTYGGLIAGQRYEPAGFAAPLGLKDIRLALAAGESLQVPMPLASLVCAIACWRWWRRAATHWTGRRSRDWPPVMPPGRCPGS